MLNFKTETGKRFKIPEDFSEITWLQYCEVHEKTKDVEGDEEILTRVISCLTSLTYEEVREMPYSGVMQIAGYLEYSFTEPPLKQISEFECGGKTWELPKVVHDWVSGSKQIGKELKFGQFTDYMTIQKEMAAIEGGNLRRVPKLLALLCKEKGGEFDKDGVEERAQLFTDIDVLTGMGAAFFLTSSTTSFLKVINHYLKAGAEKQTPTLPNTDGSAVITHLRKA